MPLPPAADQIDDPSRDTVQPGAHLALALLLAINLLNYIDRQLLIAVLPKIEESLAATDRGFAADPDHQAKLGLLTTAFMVSFLIGSLVFGWVAERGRRWVLIGIGVMLWSLACGATGTATLFLLLLATRCMSGIGEAAYGPTAPSMLSDLYPLASRSRVLGLFYVASPVGVAAGYLFGGYMADSELGWRWAFYFVLPPGILLGLLCFLMREPPRRHSGRVRLRDYFVLLHTPSYVLNTLGMTAMMFAAGGCGAWLNTYLYERDAQFVLTAEVFAKLRAAVPADVLDRLDANGERTLSTTKEFDALLKEHLSDDERKQYRTGLFEAFRQGPSLSYINTHCGVMGMTGGFLAILLGPILADRLRRRRPGAYFLVSGWAMLAGLPSFLGVLVTPLPWTWGFVFLTAFTLFLGVGPTSAILANVAHPSMRATAFAVNLFCIHAFGDAISPFLIGWIADRFDLQTGLALVSLVLLLGGMLWLWGARFLQRDIELAPTRLGDPKKL